MEIQLDQTATLWKEKAYRFAVDELIPHEVAAELNGGELPGTVARRHKKLAIELGFSSMDVPRE
jgi:hypothetical protein